jgi:hypothetical protein
MNTAVSIYRKGMSPAVNAIREIRPESYNRTF